MARSAQAVVRWTFLAVGLLSIPALAITVSRLLSPAEAGYGDSYILYDVLNFRQTGYIYRDLSLPPYLPAQYSPLTYAYYALPGWIWSTVNPFVGPRVLALAAFVACLAVCLSLVKALNTSRAAVVWGALLAVSVSVMWEWPLQIRADFPGIGFSLLCMRLLLSGQVVLAALAAAMALQFKITFVAAGLAGALWLASRRRWRSMGQFIAVGLAASIGPYLLYLQREPRMASQMFVLSPGVMDTRGVLPLVMQVVSEPAMLLAALALTAVPWRGNPRWGLLGGFAVVSLAMAIVTSQHAGANVNYYFEALFGVVPLSVRGLTRLRAIGRRFGPFAITATLVVAASAVPVRAVYAYLAVTGQASTRLRDEQLRALEPVLRQHRTLSTVPRLALMDPHPPLTEPYLFSYLSVLGKVNREPIVQPVRAGQFEAIFTAAQAQSWRTVPLIEPSLRAAIAESYRPHCTLLDVLVHLPRAEALVSPTLTAELGGLGCRILPPDAPVGW